MAEKIKASMIIEMIGRPVGHLTATMNQLLETLGSEKGIKISGKNVHEPKKVENKDKEGNIIEVPKESELSSTFSEIELEADNILDLTRVCFKYMPSHIEITEPDKFELKNLDFASMLNEIITRLHNYDAVAKAAIMENQVLAQRFRQMHEAGGINSEQINIVKANKEEKKKKSGRKIKTQ